MLLLAIKLFARLDLLDFEYIERKHLDKSIKQKSITVTKRHKKKSTKLRKEKVLIFGENTKYVRYKVYIFASYQLSCKEVGALSFGLN